MTPHDNSAPAPADDTGRLLRAAMREKGINERTLATLANVDERTIKSVMRGAPSRYTTKAPIAAALGMTVAEIWPDSPVLFAADAPTVRARVFPSRAEVPSAFWSDVFTAANKRIDILVYGGTFLFDSVPGFLRTLTDAADRGVAVRFVVGDPESQAVHARGIEESLGVDLAGRCRMTLRQLAPLMSVEGVEVRIHATPLYTSMFFADDTVYANHHIYGLPAGDNPVIELTRRTHENLFDKYATTFAHVWNDARPVQTSPRY
ncbi:hypothetical protein [Microbacterium sp. 22242]|uniref:hypothetical protein n=1 Tax=Microbacterium sp. 22242 TaxID=3453896 RepID=UPI003F831E20